MKHKFFIFLFSLVLTLSLGSFERVSACSCSGRSICEAFGDSKAVFIGKVIEGNSPERMSDAFGLKTNEIKFVFNVQESFLGAEPYKQISVYTGLGFGDCGFPFQSGEIYLVYAYKSEGKLRTSICSGSSHISKVDAEEFKFLEAAAKRKWNGGRVFGNVSAIKQRKQIDFNTREIKESISRINLKMSDGINTQTIRTDEKGNYEIDGLEAKNYKLELLLPENYIFDRYSYVINSRQQNWQVREFEMSIGGCRQENFTLINDSNLSGKIVGLNGKGLAKASVELIPITSPDKLELEEVYDTETNENGEFNLKAVPTGKYFLGVNLAKSPDEQQPYQRTFYPGTTDRNQATVVDVKPGQKTSSLNFQLTKKLIPHLVHGTIIFADGKPAADVSITLEDVNRPHVCVNGCDIRSDSQGRFTLKGYEGYTYFVVAYDSSKDYDKFEQETVSIPPNFKLDKDYNGLKVTLKIKPKKREY